MELFRGYLATREKAAKQRFKDRDVLSFDQVKDRSEYAGVLSPETVLIDIDDPDQAETLARIVEGLQLDCRILQTTRGKHFYFRNTDERGETIIDRIGNGKRLACGLTADIKTGAKNGYAVLKYGGEERFVEWDVENGDYQAVPAFLRPVPSSVDFLDMSEGEGRNNALFSYILTLQANGFTVEECRETLRVINDYVLEEPLDADEMAKVLRDDAFQKEIFFVKGKFLFDRFAEFLRNRHHIVTIGGQLHIYDQGIYTPDQKAIEAHMIRYIPGLKDSQRNEVLKYLRIICEEADEVAGANFIAFQNGIYDLETGHMREFDPSIVLTNKIACDYDPGAYSEIMDRTLDKLACGDRQIRALLEECAGYCMYRRNELSKAFILTGDKSNGKSTFLEAVTAMLGSENVSNLDIGELGGRFSTVTLFGRLANVGDDISDEFMRGGAVSTFKKITSGNRIKAEQKGQPAFEFKPYVKLLFSANDVPRMRDKTGAVLRRLVIVPFNATFSKEDPDFDPYIGYKLQSPESLRYLARLGIEGLRRVLENRSFTECEQVAAQLRDYELENDPALLFFADTEADEIENEATADVYRRYSLFCAENGYTPLSASAFTKKVTAHYGFATVRKRVSGERVRVFAGTEGRP